MNSLLWIIWLTETFFILIVQYRYAFSGCTAKSIGDIFMYRRYKKYQEAPTYFKI